MVEYLRSKELIIGRVMCLEMFSGKENLETTIGPQVPSGPSDIDDTVSAENRAS